MIEDKQNLEVEKEEVKNDLKEIFPFEESLPKTTILPNSIHYETALKAIELDKKYNNLIKEIKSLANTIYQQFGFLYSIGTLQSIINREPACIVDKRRNIDEPQSIREMQSIREKEGETGNVIKKLKNKHFKTKISFNKHGS